RPGSASIRRVYTSRQCIPERFPASGCADGVCTSRRQSARTERKTSLAYVLSGYPHLAGISARMCTEAVMIIDCHCHAGPGDGLTGPWDTNARLDRYLDRATTACIDKTVLFAAFHSNYQFANREVARIVASDTDRFYGFAFVHPERDRGRVNVLVREAV